MCVHVWMCMCVYVHIHVSVISPHPLSISSFLHWSAHSFISFHFLLLSCRPFMLTLHIDLFPSRPTPSCLQHPCTHILLSHVLLVTPIHQYFLHFTSFFLRTPHYWFHQYFLFIFFPIIKSLLHPHISVFLPSPSYLFKFTFLQLPSFSISLF